MMGGMQSNSERFAIIGNLVEVAKVDTLNSDLYLLRARIHLQKEMSREDYRIMKQEQITLTNLPNQIRNAMAEGDWPKVYEFSRQYETLKMQLEDKQTMGDLAKIVYESHDTFINPFSPGMHAIAGISLNRLAGLRDSTVNRLKELAFADQEWQLLYERRASEFSTLLVVPNIDDNDKTPSAEVLEEEANAALEAGNFEKLAQLAGHLKQSSVRTSDLVASKKITGQSSKEPADYSFVFTPELTKRAKEIGLAPFHVPSRHKEFAPLCRLAWHPAYAQTESNNAGVVHVPDLPLPDGVPEPLKTRIQLFAMHPFINSAGIRFLPAMVGEDALIENFAEPEKGSSLPKSRLLELLGLPQRDQLSRLQIEEALQEKGHDILKKEVGLDPTEFRVVCIPPDLHLRIGLELGWGQQQVWTHFDGYMIMSDGRQQALVGGDIRFGGIYDLLGVPLKYTSERLIARFAVVQRKRMAT